MGTPSNGGLIDSAIAGLGVITDAVGLTDPIPTGNAPITTGNLVDGWADTSTAIANDAVAPVKYGINAAGEAVDAGTKAVSSVASNVVGGVEDLAKNAIAPINTAVNTAQLVLIGGIVFLAYFAWKALDNGTIKTAFRESSRASSKAASLPILAAA